MNERKLYVDQVKYDHYLCYTLYDASYAKRETKREEEEKEKKEKEGCGRGKQWVQVHDVTVHSFRDRQ